MNWPVEGSFERSEEATARTGTPNSPSCEGGWPPITIGGLTPREAGLIHVAVLHYHDAIWTSPKALAYLASRGISPATVRRYRLGFGNGGLMACLRRRGLSLAAARSIGLLHGERDAMLGRVVIPDLRSGRATWLTGRSIDGREPRYLNVRLVTPLLGLDEVQGDDVVVTEGPFDWLTAVQWGLPALALVGSHVSHSTFRALSRFRRVYLALDSDDAGRRAAAQLAAGLAGRSYQVTLPAGVKDLGDVRLRTNGREAFMCCLTAATATKEEMWDTNDIRPALRAA